MPAEFGSDEEKFTALEFQLYDLLRKTFDSEDRKNLKFRLDSGDLKYGSNEFLSLANSALADERILEQIVKALLMFNELRAKAILQKVAEDTSYAASIRSTIKKNLEDS